MMIEAPEDVPQSWYRELLQAAKCWLLWHKYTYLQPGAIKGNEIWTPYCLRCGERFSEHP